MKIHNIHIRHVPISNPLPVVAYSVAMAKRFCIKYDTFVEHLKYCDTQMPHFLEMPSLVTKVTKFIVNQTAWLPREKNRQIYFYMYKIQKKSSTQCSILPLNAVLGLLLNKSNTFQNICDIIYTSFLPDSQLICGLNKHKVKLSLCTSTTHVNNNVYTMRINKL